MNKVFFVFLFLLSLLPISAFASGSDDKCLLNTINKLIRTSDLQEHLTVREYFDHRLQLKTKQFDKELNDLASKKADIRMRQFLLRKYKNENKVNKVMKCLKKS